MNNAGVEALDAGGADLQRAEKLALALSPQDRLVLANRISASLGGAADVLTHPVSHIRVMPQSGPPLSDSEAVGAIPGLIAVHWAVQSACQIAELGVPDALGDAPESAGELASDSVC